MKYRFIHSFRFSFSSPHVLFIFKYHMIARLTTTSVEPVISAMTVNSKSAPLSWKTALWSDSSLTVTWTQWQHHDCKRIKDRIYLTWKTIRRQYSPPLIVTHRNTLKIAVEIFSRDIKGGGQKWTPTCLRLIKRSWVFYAGFIRNTFNRVFCYCLKYSNKYSDLNAVSPIFTPC